MAAEIFALRCFRALACCLAILLLAISTPALRAEPFDGNQLFRDVRYYSELGYHRTGSAGDRRTSAWLATRLREAGLTVDLQPFDFVRFDARRVGLRIDGRQVPALPAWLPGTTGQGGVTAPVQPFDGQHDVRGAIAYVDPAHSGAWHETDVSGWASRAVAAGAVALVLAVDHPSGQLYQHNAKPPHVETPLPLPVLIVGRSDMETLRSATGRQANLVLTGRLERHAKAFNVVARIEKSPGAPWIVVSTPISGWFRCAGERGPGVALWLAAARWAARSGDTVNYLFIGASGHEIDYAGARALLTSARLPRRHETAFWLHLGASIGTRDWAERDGKLIRLQQVPKGRFLFANEAWQSQVQASFAAVPGLTTAPIAPLPPGRGGELALFREAGYPVSGFVGDHRFFHTPRDLPDATSPELLAPYGRGLSNLLQSLSAKISGP